MHELYAEDRAGRRRKLGPNDVLRDGETMRCTVMMMDGHGAGVTALASLFLRDSGFDVRGKSNAELMREVVRRRIGDAAVTGRSEEYIQAAFDTLTSMARPGSAPSLQTQVADHRADAEAARDEMIRGLNDGWKQHPSEIQDNSTKQPADNIEVRPGETPHDAYSRWLAAAWRNPA